MEDDFVPIKRRKVDGQNAIDVSPLSVKPDKFQKLRKIAASCEKIQSSKNDDAIISSVGSSPSTTPCPDSLASLSTPVNPIELNTKLTALAREREKTVDPGELQAKLAAFVRDEKSVDPAELQAKLAALVRNGDSVSQIGRAEQKKAGASEVTENKLLSPTLKDVGEPTNGRDEGKTTKIPVNQEEFRALVKRLINEKMKKLEDSYTENIIPNLEKKISNLESENKYLEERARLLQKNLTTLLEEYRKQLQKPSQRSVAIQTTVEVQAFVGGNGVPAVPNKSVSAVHGDSAPGVHKPTSSQISSSMNGPYPGAPQNVASGVRYSMISNGSMYTTMAGQPRLYNGGVNQRPGSHPNALVSPRAYQPFARPNGPVTAAVYPQPQNIPLSPSNHNIPRNSPPSPRNPEQPPTGGYIYTQQNGMVIRPSGQPTAGNPATQSIPYPGNADRRAHSMPVHVALAPRHQIPNASQGRPPDYQTTINRQQAQASYPPGSMQMSGARHYAPRAGGPAPPRNVVMASAPGILNGPRQTTVSSQVTTRPQISTYSRPSGPPPLVRAQQQQQHMTQAASPRFQGPAPVHGMPTRPNGPQNAGRMNMPQVQSNARLQAPQGAPQLRHPVPSTTTTAPQIPPQSSTATGEPRGLPPPAPDVSISTVSNGIVLSWNMTIPEGCASIDSYQLFAYQNNGNVPHSPSFWKKLGIVKALPLPMACTLTQFVSGSVYHFAVRAIDVYGRAGNYSAPCAITLPSENGKTGPH